MEEKQTNKQKSIHTHLILIWEEISAIMCRKEFDLTFANIHLSESLLEMKMSARY
jgi:hypothetical protein